MSEFAKKISILYVEDEQDVQEGYARTLKRISKELFLASDGNEGIEIYKDKKPDLIITDINMPKKNGIKMAEEIKAIDENQAIIFTTAYTDSKHTLEALNLQVEGYIIKPVDKKKLKIKVEQIAKTIVIERKSSKIQKILQKILDYQSSITILTDFKSIEIASKSFYRLFGIEDKNTFFKIYPNLLDVFVKHDKYLHGDTEEKFLRNYENLTQENRIVSTASMYGDVKAFYIEIDKIDELYILTLTDITKIQEEKLEAQYKATHDKLTELYNKSKFEEYLHIRFKRAIRYKRELSLAIMDIDNFKNINDNYGHLEGDRVLKNIASILLKNVREVDVVARWGGEEFVLLMDETSANKAFVVCEKLRIAIEELKIENLPSITISIGLTSVKNEDNIESFFKRADDALYKAKQSGKNRVIINA